eukprot:536840_1
MPKPKINTETILSTPLISSSTSFNVKVSISLSLFYLQQILSNNNVSIDSQSINNSINNPTYKQFIIECDNGTNFSHILNQFSLMHLLDINTIKVSIIDETNDKNEIIENFNENICDKLLSKFHIAISFVNDNWYCNTVNKIKQIDLLINNLIYKTKLECNKLKQCESLEVLRVKYNIINNGILSKFVDIDALIDMHGNDIANIESLIYPYLSTNKNRLLKLFKSKIHKMDYDLQNISEKWNNKSVEIEKYLCNALNKCMKEVCLKYKLWNTEQVIYWLQYILKDEILFDEKDIENLKIANIAGININNIDRYILELIGIQDEMLQNITIASIHNLIDKYDKNKNIW